MAAPTTYLTINKRFTYKATNEEWSNSYALSGTTPADSTAWRTLFDALVAEEKKLYKSLVSVVGGYGYAGIPDTGDSAIWSVDLTVAPNTPVIGSLTGAMVAGPGDTAAWVRWGLNRFTSPGGKRIYLRKYFHPAYLTGGDDAETLHSSWVTAAAAFGAKMRDGSFASSRTIVDKDGNVPIGHAVAPYATTRTLKRRGKRPPS